MRKYISVILILIFLFDIGGYYLWFWIWQKRQKISQKYLAVYEQVTLLPML